jgi:type II secretory pathway component PulJ
MTLLELLVAMTLLAALGGFIVQLLKNSFDLYHAGESRGEYGVNSSVVMSLLEDDLANVAHGPDGRFLLERKRLAQTSLQADPFLRFVRTIPAGDLEHRFLRLAGTKPKPELDWKGREPAPESRDALKPASGMLEVCYALLQEPRDDPGVLTLYRGVRTPVLEPGGFFDLSAETAESGYDAAWVRKNLQPIVSGILSLDILCWGPETTEWERGTSGSKKPTSAFAWWDSTRGILDGVAFSLAAGPASVLDSRDDLYPSRVRIAVTLARPGRPDARLARRLGPGEDTLVVTALEALPREGDESQLVMIAGERVEIVRHEMGQKRIARPALKPGNDGFAVPAGTAVYVGKLFERTVNLPNPRPSYEGLAR